MKGKRKFYMEWWVLGDESRAIQAKKLALNIFVTEILIR